MRILSCLLLITFAFSCNNIKTDEPQRELVPEPDLTERLHIQKTVTDTLFYQNRDKIVVYVKRINKKVPEQVFDAVFPEDVETTYNILQDTLGNIVTVSEYPFSESGDWYISLRYYFDKDGNTYAFQKQTNFFNSICTEGIAYETETTFYNPDFKPVDNLYLLVDENNKPLTKDSCSFPYEIKYEAIKNLSTYLDKNNLPPK